MSTNKPLNFVDALVKQDDAGPWVLFKFAFDQGNDRIVPGRELVELLAARSLGNEPHGQAPNSPFCGRQGIAPTKRSRRQGASLGGREL